MSMASGFMVMRAGIRRDISGTDAYGHKKVPTVWDIVAEDVPCFVWVSSKNEVMDGGKALVVEVVKGLFRDDADIKRDDEIYQLHDRRARVVLDSPLVIDAISERQSEGGQLHKEVVLRRHRG